MVAVATSILPVVHAELLEEIVANVNGGIITRTELDSEQERMLAEAYKRFTGEELYQNVRRMKDRMLVDMIGLRILLDRALALFTDVEGVKDMYYEGFKENEGITDDAEFERLLDKEGMTIADFKQRLLETFGPQEVLRVEVGNRVAVSDAEVEQFYQDNKDEFKMDDQVTVREIVVLAATESDRPAALAKAEMLVAKLNDGEEFAEVAKEASDAGTKEDGGLLGKVGRGDLSTPLEMAAFEMAEGQISAPIETPYGYHILKVDSRTIGESRSLEDVRENVRLVLEDQKHQEQLNRFLTKMRGEAEWCIRPKYRDRVPTDFQAEICEEM